MIIFNESRLGGSRVLATYSKPRTCSTHLSLMYQVGILGGKPHIQKSSIGRALLHSAVVHTRPSLACVSGPIPKGTA